ncbi:MAG TPA: histidine ammonia-lyase, partial [Pseudoxanthomonas sp.]
ARQAVGLRQRVGLQSTLGEGPAAMYDDLCARIALVEEDRALDGELRQLVTDIRAARWNVYAG